MVNLDERLWLAAIGKHPGWNDHLDDIGLETDRLVALKRQVYVDGIGGVIGAGTWEAMDEASRDEGFSHSFLWRHPEGVLVGRMWSSSDGKGRKKYPMIVCAMCRSLPLAFIAGPVLEGLRRLEAECKAATTAAAVISAVDRARADLREQAGRTPAVTGKPLEVEPSASRLASASVMGPDGQGLCRVVYQMERDLTAYLRPERQATGSRSRTLEIRAQHMRVPRVFETEAESWSVWARLLLSRVDQLAPVLLISKDDRPWLDVIVGEPSTTQLACLQGSLEAYPLTTDIPYTISTETSDAVAAMLEQARSGEARELDPAFIDAPSDRLAPFLRAARKRPDDKAASKNQRQMLIAVIVAAVVLVLGVIVVMALRGGGDETGSSQAPAEPAPAVAAAPGPSSAPAVAGETDAPTGPALSASEAERLERFKRWCGESEAWYFPFVAALDRSAVGGDAYLSRAVGEALREAEASGVQLNPLEVAPGRYRSLGALGQNPPREVAGADYESAIGSALSHIDSVRRAIGTQWPSHDALRRVSAGVESRGESLPAEIAGILADLSSEAGADAARGVSALVALGGEPVGLASALEAVESAAGSVAETGAPEQAAWLRRVRVSPRAGGGDAKAWMTAAVARAREVAFLGEELRGAAGTLLPRVDPALLAEAMGSADGSDAEGDLRVWLAAVKDPALRLLDPGEDPRARFASGGSGEAISTRLAEVAGGGEMSPELRALADRAARWADEFRAIQSLAWNEANRQEIEQGVAALLDERTAVLVAIDTVDRERRLKAETYLASLGARERLGGSSAIDRVWIEKRNALINAYEKTGDLVGLLRGVDAVVAAAESLEAALPPPAVDLGAFGEAGERVAGLIAAERERRLEKAARVAMDGSDFSGEAEAFAAWAGGLEASAEISGGASAALERWETAGLRELDTAWRGTWLGGEIPLAQVDPRVGEVAAVVDAEDRASLAGVLTSKEAAPAALFAAWSALGDAAWNWPADDRELAIDASAAARLRGAVGLLAEGRKDEVAAVITGGARARWERAARTAEDWSAFRAVAGAAPELGIDTASVEPALGFNLMVAGLLERCEAGAAIDPAAILSEAERWLAAGSFVASHGEAAEWLGTLRDAVSGRRAAEPDYRSMGPARVGWGVTQFDSGRTLKFTWTGEGGPSVILEFRLVDNGPAGAFYLLETEVPASYLFDFALKGDRASATLAVLDPDWESLGDTRPGPRVWEWRTQRGQRGVMLSRFWTNRAPADQAGDYAASLRDGIGTPTGDHPLQRISPVAAATLAAMAGCRLPLAGEWAAAYAALGSPGASDASNLRDSAFEAQRAFVGSGSVARGVTWPDDGAFIPDGATIPRGVAATFRPLTDSFLWFCPVGHGIDIPFRHLVGNVAEYVLVSAPAALMSDRGEPAGALAQVSSGGWGDGVVGVIGGSALSAPELGLTEAHPVDPAAAGSGFADVGFRLAFSSGGEAPLSVRLVALARSAPYLRGVEAGDR